MKKQVLTLGAILVAGVGFSQIINEDFEGGALPAGWSLDQAAGSDGWLFGNASFHTSTYWGPGTDNTSLFACSNDDECNCDMSEDRIITPVMDLTNSSSVFLQFDAYYDGAYGALASVDVSTNGGSSWTNVFDLVADDAGWQQVSVDLSAYAGQSGVLVAFHHDDDGIWGSGFAVDNVIITEPFQYDLAVASIDVNDIVGLNNAPFDIVGTIVNNGSATITSATVAYAIDNGTPVTENLTGLSIAPLTSYQFTHSTTWNPGSTGMYDLEVSVSMPNGMADQDPSNDMMDKDVEVVAATVPRMPLIETYTSSTCGPCTPANTTFEALHDVNPGVFTSLKYQMSWPGTGDPYFTDEGNSRRNYYSINSIPRMEIDGAWDENGNNITQGVIDDFTSVPAFVEIDATFIRDAGQGIEVDVTINPLANINSNNLVCHIAVFEYETFNNVKSNGETEFFHVMKKMLPNANGNSIPALVGGTPVTVSQSHVFQGNYRLPNNANDPINHSSEHSVEEFDDLGVVVWIQDATTKEVHQSAYAVEDPLSGIDEINAVNDLNIYPNPTNDIANVSFTLAGSEEVSIEVFNVVGSLVMSTNLENAQAGNHLFTIDTSELNAGLYYVNVTAGDMNVTKKLTVNK